MKQICLTWRTRTLTNWPANGADAALDADGDGVSNVEEYRAGTDPLDKETQLRAALLTAQGSPLVALVTFVAVAGKTYSLLRRDSFGSGPWLPVTDVPAASSNRVAQVRDPTPLQPGELQRFYRLITPRAAP